MKTLFLSILLLSVLCSMNPVSIDQETAVDKTTVLFLKYFFTLYKRIYLYKNDSLIKTYDNIDPISLSNQFDTICCNVDDVMKVQCTTANIFGTCFQNNINVTYSLFSDEITLSPADCRDTIKWQPQINGKNKELFRESYTFEEYGSLSWSSIVKVSKEGTKQVCTYSYHYIGFDRHWIN